MYKLLLSRPGLTKIIDIQMLLEVLKREIIAQYECREEGRSPSLEEEKQIRNQKS